MTGDAQRRVAEVLADGIEEGLTDYDANVDPALFALAVARRTTPAILAVLAAEGLLVGDGPVAGGNGALSAEPCPPRPTTHETLDSLTARLVAARAATDGYRTEAERLRELLDEAHAKIERMEEL